MQQPKHFPGIVSFSTAIMGAGYVGIGMIGYWYAPSETQSQHFALSPRRASQFVHRTSIIEFHSHACRARGIAVPDVIIFGIGDDWLARAACNAILIQGIGQYLVNLNIWTHNILTLLARSQVSVYLRLLLSACNSVADPCLIQ